jgi:hypothetical protein
VSEPKVLDLDAAFSRDTVKVGGKTYELRAPQEFGIVEDHKLRKLIVAASAIDNKKTTTEADAVKASQLLRDLATMLVVDLQEEIPDWACVAIFDFWIGNAPGDDGPPPQPAPRPAAKKKTTSTGAKSSLRSKSSTAATRKRGSTSQAGR